MSKRHKDVEYHIDLRGNGGTKIFKTYDEAAGFAVQAASSHGEKVNLDIVVWSEAGAKSVMGNEGVEMYREDPEASVFLRIEVKANNTGRVP